jgi:hypothetical protein
MNMSYSLLSIEQKPGEMMRVRLKGEPVVVAKMIATVMTQNAEIAAAFITGVMQFAIEVGMPTADFESIAAAYGGK